MPPKNPRAFELREFSSPPPSPWRVFFPLLITLSVLLAGSYWFYQRGKEPSPEPVEADTAATTNRSAEASQRQQPKLFWRRFVYPTVRTNLLDAPMAESFQDTGAGVPTSGTFGTVRTGESGLGQFHEGLDIRAAQRDRRGRPLDKIFAAADGRVAYVNRIAGNSNYGKYIVLLHDDPMGEIFTLYAHLADADARVKPGVVVAAGDEIGLMGNTSSSAMPMERAHLHFEIGLVINTQFGSWYRSKRQTPDHGSWHGWNLLGLNPLDAFRIVREHGHMDASKLLASTPVAFTIAIRATQLPDLLRRYPSLWQGAPFDGSAFVLAASENGTPLSARNATREETEKLGRQSAVILSADALALGRNGRRLAQPATGGGWRLGSNCDDWLEILLYPQRVR